MIVFPRIGAILPNRRYIEQGSLVESSNFIILEAGEALQKGDPVYVNSSNNKIYKADNVTNFRVIGLVIETVPASLPVKVMTSGILSLQGLVPATPYYLTNQSISPTAPTSGYVIRIGQSLTSDSLLINIEEPILLT